VRLALGGFAAEAFADSADAGYWSAVWDDVCVGVLAYRRPGLGYGTWTLSWLAVRPAWQHRGVGRLLVNAWLADTGPHMAYVASALPAVGFYKRMGFRPVRRQRHPYGSDDTLLMVLETSINGADK
jgi:ribosomal protein S18 acetylase RimI-like enzyme